MATELQILANRANAQKSRGPTTNEGKLASRCNALKHGLSGEGVVLPPAEEAEVEKRMSEWSASYGALGHDEQWSYRQMVRESVRIDRCDKDEVSLRSRLIERAGTSWNEDRALAAEELGQKILSRPSVIARQLKSTPQGIAWLIARWEGLAAVLHNGKDWDDRFRLLAQSLLGVPAEFRELPGKLDLPPESTADLRAHRLGMVAEEIAALRSLKDGRVTDQDTADRERASRGTEVDPDRALARLRRYSASCHRRMKAASKTLKVIPKERRTDRGWLPRRLAPDLASPLAGLLENPLIDVPKPVERLPRFVSAPTARSLNRQQRRAMASLERAST
jgi:hypothetical protein